MIARMLKCKHQQDSRLLWRQIIGKQRTDILQGLTATFETIIGQYAAIRNSCRYRDDHTLVDSLFNRFIHGDVDVAPTQCLDDDAFCTVGNGCINLGSIGATEQRPISR